MCQDPEDLPEPLFPAAAARLLSDALFRLLKESQGIICQGINEDGKRVRAGIWKSKGKIRIIETKNYKLPLGAKFQMHESESEALTESVFDDGASFEL